MNLYTHVFSIPNIIPIPMFFPGVDKFLSRRSIFWAPQIHAFFYKQQFYNQHQAEN